MFEVRDLCCGYAGVCVAENVNFRVERGEVLVLLGPNGVGKTTLFKSILGLLPCLGGDVFLDGASLLVGRRAQSMNRIAYVPQAHNPSFSFTVMEIVLMGRTPHIGAFSVPTDHDRAVASQTLFNLGLGQLSSRPYTEISGGERQMVLIARALAQEPDVLVMDEPASSLDLGNQAKLLYTVHSLSRNNGLSVLMTTHNPDHAFAIADKVLLLEREGCRYGDVDEVLDDKSLSRAYGTAVEVIEKESLKSKTLKSCVLRIEESVR